jgi:membrane protease YdiL (CAAX protease family)
MDDTPADRQRVRWAPIDLAVFISFFLGTVFIVTPGAFLVWRFFDPTLTVDTISVFQELLIQGLMNVVVVGFILLMIKFHEGSILPTLRFSYSPRLPLVRLFLGGMFLAITVTIFSQFFPGPETPLEKRLTTSTSILAFGVFGAVIAPLLEEIIFRGFIFTALADIEGARVAVPLTAFLFAIPHAHQLWGNWSALLMIFLVGYVLTMVRNRFDSVVAPFIVHTSYNAMILGMSALGSALARGGPR